MLWKKQKEEWWEQERENEEDGKMKRGEALMWEENNKQSAL